MMALQIPIVQLYKTPALLLLKSVKKILVYGEKNLNCRHSVKRAFFWRKDPEQCKHIPLKYMLSVTTCMQYKVAHCLREKLSLLLGLKIIINRFRYVWNRQDGEKVFQ